MAASVINSAANRRTSKRRAAALAADKIKKIVVDDINNDIVKNKRKKKSRKKQRISSTFPNNTISFTHNDAEVLTVPSSPFLNNFSPPVPLSSTDKSICMGYPGPN